MTNEEIAARAIADAETPVGGGYMHDGHLDGLTCEALAAAVVAALTEAGRLRGVDRKVRDAIDHLLLFVEQGEHGWTIEGKAATVRAWLDAEPTP